MQTLFGCRQRSPGAPPTSAVAGGIALERLDGDTSTEAAGDGDARPPRSSPGNACQRAARQPSIVPAVHVVTDFRSDVITTADAAAALDARDCSDAEEDGDVAAELIRPGGSQHNVGFRLGLRNVLSERRKRVADYSLACALFGLLVVVIETEMSLAQLYDKGSFYSNAVKSLITLSTVVLLGLVIAYHGLQAQLFVVENCVDDWRIALSWRATLQISAELLVCSVHPAPGVSQFTSWDALNDAEGTRSVARVPVDVLLSLPMFLRLYLVSRVLLLHSRLFSDASSRSIGALNRIDFNTRFVFKTLMTICPGTVLLVIMLSLWIVASWILRACESYHDINHRNLLNSMWMVAVTFLSVGYGDIVPNTYCGRAVAVCTGIMGSGCTALVVAVLARKMELTRAEKHVHNFMMDNELTKRLRNTAANVLRETWFIYKYTKLVPKLSAYKVRVHQRKFLQAIYRLRKIKMDQRKLNDSANTLVDMAKHFLKSPLDSTPSAYISQPPAVYRQTQTNLLEAVVEMNSRQTSVERRTDSIEDSLRCLQEQLDALPGLVMERLTVRRRPLANA